MDQKIRERLKIKTNEILGDYSPKNKREMEVYVRGVLHGMQRHSWMRNGTVFVGNGQYTMQQAISMMMEDIEKGETNLS